ncbi:MAG: regulatory iron-sulfur-containing complex subunit RicT [Pirellulales bacterium]
MPKYIVRHGSMRFLGVFTTRGSDTFARGNQVVARTSRGVELGEVLCEATDEALQHVNSPGTGQILRLATTDDQNEMSHLAARQRDEFALCRRRIAELRLQMELVDLEHLFGGERIVVYYLAEERVDFRELVKILAADFQTRIEMRQIGVRDEAKLLADYGDCGKPVCCNTHLAEMPPVSMKMAKLQKATLDPSKISGRCGRLKCCLRYEFDTYIELQAELPRPGSTVLTRDGRGRVLSQSILTSQVLVESEEGRRSLVHLSDIVKTEPPGRGGPPPRDDDSGSPRRGDNRRGDSRREEPRQDDRRGGEYRGDRQRRPSSAPPRRPDLPSGPNSGGPNTGGAAPGDSGDGGPAENGSADGPEGTE